MKDVEAAPLTRCTFEDRRLRNPEHVGHADEGQNESQRLTTETMIPLCLCTFDFLYSLWDHWEGISEYGTTEGHRTISTRRHTRHFSTDDQHSQSVGTPRDRTGISRHLPPMRAALPLFYQTTKRSPRPRTDDGARPRQRIPFVIFSSTSSFPPLFFLARNDIFVHLTHLLSTSSTFLRLSFFTLVTNVMLDFYRAK